MRYVVYNKETKKILTANPLSKAFWDKRRDAVRLLNRMSKLDPTLNKADYDITDVKNFYNNIEQWGK